MRMSVLPSENALTAARCSAGGAEARDVLDRERVVAQALGERAEVLLGEDRRRHEHQHLLAGVGRLERGAQRDLGLAVADVAADQAVHRALGLHVPLDVLDRLALVGRLAVGERGLEVAQPVRVGREREAAAPAALGVEVEQLAGELLGGAAGARLDRVPARPAELGERRMLAAGADVARDLRELVDRHEDPVRALELEVEVVARDPGDGLRVEAGEAREAVVLVDDDVAGAQVGERAQQPAPAPRRALDAPAAVDQPVLGDRRELQRRGDEAVAQVGLGEDEPAGVGGVPAGPQALQVVGGALALAALRPGDDRRVARARELLELRLGLVERARGELGGLGAELDRLRAGDRGQPQRLARLERGDDGGGLDVEVVGVGVVEGGADVVPVVAQRGLEVLVGGDHDVGVLGEEVEQLAEAVDRQQLGDVGAAVGVLERGDLGELAVLGGELGGGRDLDPLRLAQRALGERREPAQRLDLDVEELDADGALLGRRVDVEQPAAGRELPAVLDLVDALVARGDELAERSRRGRAARRPRARSRAGAARGRAPSPTARRRRRRRPAPPRPGEASSTAVQRRDAQPDEVRRRGEVRLVGDAAAGVEAHRPRAQPGAQVGGEVAGGAVVAGDDHGRAAHVAVGDRRDQERPQRLRDERARARLVEASGVGVVLEMAEEGAE